eukprot:2559721-Pleurochrysis_carterae.AAC.1
MQLCRCPSPWCPAPDEKLDQSHAGGSGQTTSSSRDNKRARSPRTFLLTDLQLGCEFRLDQSRHAN